MVEKVLTVNVQFWKQYSEMQFATDTCRIKKKSFLFSCHNRLEYTRLK